MAAVTWKPSIGFSKSMTSSARMGIEEMTQWIRIMNEWINDGWVNGSRTKELTWLRQTTEYSFLKIIYTSLTPPSHLPPRPSPIHTTMLYLLPNHLEVLSKAGTTWNWVGEGREDNIGALVSTASSTGSLDPFDALFSNVFFISFRAQYFSLQFFYNTS